MSLVSPITQQIVPGTSSPRCDVAPHEVAQHERRPDAAERPSGTLNQKTHDQPIVDERAAEHGADHEPDGGHHRVRAHRETELLDRERVGHDRARVREDQRPADPLQHAPADQLAVPLEAKPAPSEASENTTKPATYARLRPNRSESRPADITSTVDEMM